MGTVYVATGTSGEHQPYDEAQLRALWEQKHFGPQALYWNEGISQWRPLAEYFASDQPMSAEARGSVQPTYAYKWDTRKLTKFVVVLLVATIAHGVVEIVGDFMTYEMLGRSFTAAEAEQHDEFIGLIALAGLPLWLLTTIIFLRWKYASYYNCEGFAKHMRFSPGWSVGYYFIPILNLFRPYQCMKEIWQVSTNPESWQRQRVSALLIWWWALWLICAFLGQISLRLTLRAETIEELRTEAAVSIVFNMIYLALCVVAILMVRAISHKQQVLVLGEQDVEPSHDDQTSGWAER